jgi:hypothetical protein
MRNIFKRRRHAHRAELAHAPKISVPDLLVARWHGLTPEQWGDLSTLAKVDHREAYSHAWGLAS